MTNVIDLERRTEFEELYKAFDLNLTTALTHNYVFYQDQTVHNLWFDWINSGIETPVFEAYLKDCDDPFIDYHTLAQFNKGFQAAKEHFADVAARLDEANERLTSVILKLQNSVHMTEEDRLRYMLNTTPFLPIPGKQAINIADNIRTSRAADSIAKNLNPERWATNVPTDEQITTAANGR